MSQNRKLYRETLRIYWRFAREQKKHLAFVLFAVLFHVSIYVASPLVVANIIGSLANGNDNPVDYGILILVLATLQVAGAIFDNIAIKAQIRTQLYGAEQIELYMLRTLQQKSYAFFTNNFAGSLVNDYIKFVGAYVGIIDITTQRLLSFTTTYVFSVGVIAYYDLRLAITFAVLTLAFLFVAYRQTRVRVPLRRAANIAISKRTGSLADILANIITVKTFAHEKQEERIFQKYVKDVTITSKKSWYKGTNNSFVVLLFSGILLVVSVAGAVTGVLNNSLDIAIIILVQAYAFRITGGIYEMSGFIKSFEQGLSDAIPMTERLLEEPEIKDSVSAKSFRPNNGTVAFKNVSFQYKENKQQKLFEDFTLDIASGEKIGLVGRSGSGKTTLTTLLLRFMDVVEGQILLDGVDITDIKQTSVRNAIAYVPQEPIMFHRSIMENIRYGRLNATEEEVHEAARLAYASEFIEKLPHGYDTLVGERGMKLSGGQRQRVAIARAILKNAPIIVLDEATSALDSESEQLIQDALAKLMQKRTAIVIAHRLSTIQKMDRIVLLEDGQIKEVGSHEYLLKQNGDYAKLWKRQSGGFLPD